MMSKCRKRHLRKPKFAKFPGGGGMPRTPLEAGAFGAKRVSLFSFKRAWNLCEVERKPNFDLWLFRVRFPVHGYRPKKHSCKDTKMATPVDFCRGMSRPVNWTCDKTYGEHVSM